MSIASQSTASTGADNRTRTPVPFDNDGLSITEIFAVLWRYRRFILLSTLAFAVFVAGVSAVMYFSGETASSRMQFRLNFEGAASGKYPSGIEFSVNEIISPSVLDAAYDINHLSDRLQRAEFRDAVAVVKSDNGYSFVEAKYTTLLSNKDLPLAEYQRLLDEYESAKRKFLNRAEYHLVFNDNGLRVPFEIQEKVFADILIQWELATQERKGLYQYQVPEISDYLFVQIERSNEEQLIKVDRLKSTFQRVKEFAETIAGLPGALSQRSSSDVDIATILIRLQDLERFKVLPLTRMVRQFNNRRDGQKLFYLEGQLEELVLREQELASTVELLRDVLGSYDRGGADKSGGANVTDVPDEGGIVSAQISGDFLDRLLALASHNKDVEYRQGITDQTISSGKRLLQVRREIAYYRNILEENANSLAVEHNRLNESFKNEFDAVLAELKKLVEEARDIHLAVSESMLSAEHGLFTILGPVEYQRISAIPLRKVVRIGIALTLLFVCLVASFFIFRESCRQNSP